jgi:hypothetical protein
MGSNPAEMTERGLTHAREQLRRKLQRAAALDIPHPSERRARAQRDAVHACLTFTM